MSYPKSELPHCTFSNDHDHETREFYRNRRNLPFITQWISNGNARIPCQFVRSSVPSSPSSFVALSVCICVSVRQRCSNRHLYQKQHYTRVRVTRISSIHPQTTSNSPPSCPFCAQHSRHHIIVTIVAAAAATTHRPASLPAPVSFRHGARQTHQRQAVNPRGTHLCQPKMC